MLSHKHTCIKLLVLCCALAVLFTACSTGSATSSSITKATSQPSTPTPPLSAKLGAPGCHPSSPSHPWNGGPLEVQGTAKGVELWALSFNAIPFQVKHDVKIVWRMTGTGDFNLVVRGPDGRQIQPIFGPTYHPSSNWERPGQEWGTGYNFPVSGCWNLHAIRGNDSGDVWLLVQ